VHQNARQYFQLASDTSGLCSRPLFASLSFHGRTMIAERLGAEALLPDFGLAAGQAVLLSQLKIFCCGRPGLQRVVFRGQSGVPAGMPASPEGDAGIGP
jgi:hypothetical protein